jgi:hypothetical protein
VGDFFRILAFVKLGAGGRFSIFVVLLERLTDSFVTSLFLFGFIRNQISTDYANLAFRTLLLIALSMSFALWGKNFSFLNSEKLRLRNIMRVVSRRDLTYFFLRISLAWLLAYGAIRILASRQNGVLENWLNWNRNFGDPLHFLFSNNSILAFVLILPPVTAALISQLFPTARFVAKRSMRTYRRISNSSGSTLDQFSKLVGGSGAKLFANQDAKVIVRIEEHGTSEPILESHQFMSVHRELFGFPTHYWQGNILGRSCMISELIADSTTGKISQTVFSASRNISFSEKKENFELLVATLQKIHRSKQNLNVPDESLEIPNSTVNALLLRLNRAEDHVLIKLGALRCEDRELTRAYVKLNSFVKGFLLHSSLWRNATVIHGDASLSNFLLQKTNSGKCVRSIDPNLRIGMHLQEYDFGKILQSTHGIYEEILINDEFGELSRDQFYKRRSELGFDSVFDEILRKLGGKGEIDLELVNIFALTHWMRMLPYRTHEDAEKFRFWVKVTVWLADEFNFSY